MPQTQPAVASPYFVPAAKSLPEQIAEAVECRATPLSRLLRLMAALDGEDGEDQRLRMLLRARIGAPLDA